MSLDIVISCFPQRWQSERQHTQHPEGKARNFKEHEPPSLPRQDPSLGKPPADVPEASDQPTVSSFQKPSSMPKPQMDQSDQTPSPGRSRGGEKPLVIVNPPQEKRDCRDPLLSATIVYFIISTNFALASQNLLRLVSSNWV